MSKPVMKLMEPRTGEMQCKVCGHTHFALVQGNSDGRFKRGSWQCIHKCQLPSKSEPQAYNGWGDKWIDPSEMHQNWTASD
jgi:hypothetical protein